MSAIREIEWEPCLLEPMPDHESEQRFRAETGRPAGVIRFFVGSPVCVDVVIELSRQVASHTYIDVDLADFAGLVVSQDNSCRYCFGAMRALLRIMGMPEARIGQLELDLHTADFGAKERTALDFVRRLSRSSPLVGQHDLEALRNVGFEEVEIVELAGIAMTHLFFNRLSTLPALPPARIEALPDQWYVRVLRPLLKQRLGRTRRYAAPVRLEPGEAEGPFAPLVSALDGLPLARTLRRTLDSIFTRATLPPRTTALIFAVVARALGCARCQAESIRLVRETGLSDDEIEQTLTHLACPALDPVERLLVPLARETVWYQPAQIQRRARTAQASLSREQFLEFVTVAALANAVCRLGVIAGDCR